MKTPAAVPDARTRERVEAYLLAHGTATTADVSAELGLGQAAIRKHLDAMIADGTVTTLSGTTRSAASPGATCSIR